MVLLVAMKDPIPLRHFGKKEILAKTDLMENWYDQYAGEEIGSWGYGVSVYIAARATGGRW